MSQAAYRLAVASHLKTQLSLSDSEIRGQLNPKPIPYAGNVYIAVHPGPFRRNPRTDYHFDENHGFYVTFSVRGQHVPVDRWGEVLNNFDDGGFEWFTRKLITLIDFNYDVMSAADDNIRGTVAGFMEPAQFQSASEPTSRGDNWWGADGNNQEAGFSVQIAFVGARRIQSHGDLA